MKTPKEILALIPSREEQEVLLKERAEEAALKEAELAARTKTKFLEAVEGALLTAAVTDFKAKFTYEYMGEKVPLGVVQAIEELTAMGYSTNIHSPESNGVKQGIHFITVEAVEEQL
jgi:hypothetical protein